MTRHLNSYIGKKIRERRKKASISLSTLAEKLGVTLQQLQKYEKATNRVPTEILYKLAKIFKVSVNYFFEGFQSASEESANLLERDELLIGNNMPLNILMIEDDAGDEFITRKFIEESEHPCSVYTAHDGDTALEMLRGPHYPSLFSRPDLIILDLTLPKRDGREILTAIKRDPRIQDIPVVVITNNLSRQQMIAAYKGYANSYICKSGEISIFKERINLLIKYWALAVALPRANHLFVPLAR